MRKRGLIIIIRLCPLWPAYLGELVRSKPFTHIWVTEAPIPKLLFMNNCLQFGINVRILLSSTTFRFHYLMCSSSHRFPFITRHKMGQGLQVPAINISNPPPPKPAYLLVERLLVSGLSYSVTQSNFIWTPSPTNWSPYEVTTNSQGLFCDCALNQVGNG